MRVAIFGDFWNWIRIWYDNNFVLKLYVFILYYKKFKKIGT